MPRRFQFSLRAFLVVVALFAAWTGVLAHRVHSQQNAIARIEALGGTVYYEHQDISRRRRVQPVGAPAPQFDRSLQAPAPLWMRKLMGDDWFRDVAVVDLSEANVEESQMQALHAALPHAAISAPMSWGSLRHHIWPEQVVHFDAPSLAVALAGMAAIVWVAGLFVARRRV